MIELKRIQWIDIAKGICILLVVIGHAGAPFTHFIYLFHVAVFFMFSGYLFNPMASHNKYTIISYIIGKIKSLWLPYFVCTCIFISLNNIFIDIGFYITKGSLQLSNVETTLRTVELLSQQQYMRKIINAAIFQSSTQVGGGLWFIIILFYASILFCCIDFVLKRIFGDDACVCHAIIGYICMLFFWNNAINDNKFQKVDIAYILMVLGHSMYWFDKYYDDALRFKPRLQCYNSVFATLLSFLILFIANKYGSIELSINKIQNPWFFVIVSISGWILVKEISLFLNKYNFIANILSYIGRRSFWILALHFLAFKFVNLIYVYIYDLSKVYYASFPTVPDKAGMWWLMYAFVGILLPLLVEYILRFTYKYTLKNDKRIAF